MKTMLSIGLDAKHEYGAFGEPLRVGGTAIAADNPFRFSTKYTDVESGLVYYGFRYYSPSLGRFLNRDPIGEMGGTNLYAFVENDPVNGWDYLGLEEACDPADSAAGLCDETPRRRGFFKRLGKGIGNAIGGIGRAVGSIGQGLGQAVGNVGQGVVNIVGNVGMRIVGTVRNVGVGIFGTGADESIYQEHDGEGIAVLEEFEVREDQIPESKEGKRRQKTQNEEEDRPVNFKGGITYRRAALLLSHGRFSGVVVSDTDPAKIIEIKGHLNGVGLQVGVISGQAPVSFTANSVEDLATSKQGGLFQLEAGFGVGPVTAAEAGGTLGVFPDRQEEHNVTADYNIGYLNVAPVIDVWDLLEKPKFGFGIGASFTGITITSAEVIGEIRIESEDLDE